ncbi:glycosyltransferase family 2 protein [Niabella yanshanensis]|uniref:Glycosyltransferase family 2 protein n=1 Tax=Niabella yanshanensis TaxID=577386 RepID=A0ABZ0W2N8_9BACT|nr:glycosyltransferase family 2 protein [Niabella yanshanensis]WQD36898.1 glycosyltransferase family 2 protein [Niabella yanshanensis]
MTSKKKKIDISLVVSTYNWPSALRLCLMSILEQTMMPREVIIADDGSELETTVLLEEFKNKFPIPLVHVWQKDNGFQLARIRNKAMAKAKGEYIVQIDGDLILHKSFVRDHFKFRKEKSFVTGSRVMLSKELSERLLANQIIKVSLFSKGVSNFFNGVRMPFIARRMERYRNRDVMYVRGCNMAFWKRDIFAVNGYNESFVGWGREDNDIAVRLNNAGLKKRAMKHAGIVFHIFHTIKSRADLEENDILLKQAIENGIILSPKGLDQYL